MESIEQPQSETDLVKDSQSKLTRLDDRTPKWYVILSYRYNKRGLIDDIYYYSPNRIGNKYPIYHSNITEFINRLPAFTGRGLYRLFLHLDGTSGWHAVQVAWFARVSVHQLRVSRGVHDNG